MMRCSVPAESNHRKNWLTRLSIMQRIFSPPTAASASCPHRAPCAAADDLKSSALLWGALHKAENPTWQTVPLGVCAGPRSADYLTDMGVDQKKHCFHWRQTEQDQANLNSSRLAEPLAQALHRLALTANAQQRALAVGALLQHLAGREDFAAQLLCRPGKEEIGLDEVLAKERDDRFAQQGYIAGAARAHHDAIGVL